MKRLILILVFLGIYWGGNNILYAQERELFSDTMAISDVYGLAGETVDVNLYCANPSDAPDLNVCPLDPAGLVQHEQRLPGQVVMLLVRPEHAP